MSIGKRIAYLRNKNNMSQYALAEKMGFSRGKLANYEQGTRAPDYETLQEIADFFDVSRSYLLGDTDNPEKAESPDQDEKTAIINKIARDFPDADLMFHDMASMDADDLKDIYDYIKFKKSQKED